MENEYRKFLARYYFDGSWWCIDIMAKDWDEAEARCKKLGLQLDGEHVVTIRHVLGGRTIADLIIGIKNAFRRKRS